MILQNQPEPDYCQYINPNDNCTLFENPDETTACTSDSRYLYDDFEYDSTIVTELDLVCDEDYKVMLFTKNAFNKIKYIEASFPGGSNWQYLHVWAHIRVNNLWHNGQIWQEKCSYVVNITYWGCRAGQCICLFILGILYFKISHCSRF